eukprot:4633406-Prymnesium_polylepis.1
MSIFAFSATSLVPFGLQRSGVFSAMKFRVNRGGKESSAMGTSNAVAHDPSIASMAGRVTHVMRGGTGFISADAE